MITAIIFDAFGTLFQLSEGGSAKKIIHNILATDKEVDFEQFTDEWKAYYKKHTSSGKEFMTERDIFVSRIRMFYDRFGVCRNAREDTEALLADAYHRKAFEEVGQVIEELRKEYTVFIGSNTDNDVLEAVMDGNNITVDKVYTSEDLRCYKPDPEFFGKILRENGLKAEEVMFVGDSVSDDIIGPKALGIKAVLVDRKNTMGDRGQDYTVSDLRQLHEILKTVDK